MGIVQISPAALYDGAPFGMSQATVDSGSGLVFVSGQVDWGTDYQVRHESIEAQAESALQNLITVLDAAGWSAAGVLQLRVYVRGRARRAHGEGGALVHQVFRCIAPGLTGIGVASLASPQTLIDIEAVASVDLG